MVLGAVLPEMRHEVEVLANELSELIAVRKKIDAEREQLRTEIAALGGERRTHDSVGGRTPETIV